MLPLISALIALILMSVGSKLPFLTGTQVRAAALTAFNSSLADKIDRFVQNILPCHQSPALSLAIVKDGYVVLAKGYGYTSTNKSVNTTSKTRFAIASLTKAFTATLVAKWVMDQDNITIDTPIQSYLPGFRVADDLRSKKATLRDLLSHRMGIPSYYKALIMGFPEQMKRDQLMKRLSHIPTKLPFRHKLIYNNYMYSMAAYVLERMSKGDTWEHMLKCTILDPLRMFNTGFVDQEISFSDFALPCAIVNGTMVDLTTDLFRTVHPMGPAGSLYSNAEDMAKWMNFLLSGGLSHDGNYVVKPEVIKLTWEPGMLSTLPFHELNKPWYPVSHVVQSYNMGWMTAYYRGHRQIYHTGGIVTHSSRLWLYPDARVGIFVSINGPHNKNNKNNLLESLMYYMSDLLLNESPWLNKPDECPVLSSIQPKQPNNATETPPKQSPTQNVVNASNFSPQHSLQDFLGTYHHKCFGTVEISLSSDNISLICSFGRFGQMNLTRVADLEFIAQELGPLSYTGDSETLKFSRANSIDAIYMDLDPTEEMVRFDLCKNCKHNNVQLNDSNQAANVAGEVALIYILLAILL